MPLAGGGFSFLWKREGDNFSEKPPWPLTGRSNNCPWAPQGSQTGPGSPTPRTHWLRTHPKSPHSMSTQPRNCWLHPSRCSRPRLQSCPIPVPRCPVSGESPSSQARTNPLPSRSLTLFPKHQHEGSCDKLHQTLSLTHLKPSYHPRLTQKKGQNPVTLEFVSRVLPQGLCTSDSLGRTTLPATCLVPSLTWFLYHLWKEAYLSPSPAPPSLCLPCWNGRSRRPDSFL